MTTHFKLKNSLDSSWISIPLPEVKKLLPLIFKITAESLPHAISQNMSKNELYNTILKKIDEVDWVLFLKEIEHVTFHQNQYVYSWLLSEGISHDYMILDVIEELSKRKLLKEDFFIEFMLHEESLIPFDFRGKFSCLFINLIKKGLINFDQASFDRLSNFLLNFKVFPRRTIEEKLGIPTNGIDHLFPIPTSLEDKLYLLDQAALYKTQEAIFKDILSFLDAIQFTVPKGIQSLIQALKSNSSVKETLSILSTLENGKLISEKVNSLIDEDVNCSLRTWNDYLVCWDQQVVNFKGYTYTISELLRICLIAGELSYPDLLVSTNVLKFYRSTLKISGRATIGLKAGIYYGEHGISDNPTFFYMGMDSIIGKGCIIDPIGGIVMLSKSYLGGGFIPILIHTHKHILTEGNTGTDERKKILPCIFVAKQGARFPMNNSILFEAADYINKQSPYNGIAIYGIT